MCYMYDFSLFNGFRNWVGEAPGINNQDYSLSFIESWSLIIVSNMRSSSW